jgi:hypothetical protein
MYSAMLRGRLRRYQHSTNHVSVEVDRLGQLPGLATVQDRLNCVPIASHGGIVSRKRLIIEDIRRQRRMIHVMDAALGIDMHPPN